MNKQPSRRDWLQTCACAVGGMVWPVVDARAAGSPGSAKVAKTTHLRNRPLQPSGQQETFKKQFVSESGRVNVNDPEGSHLFRRRAVLCPVFALVANDRAMFDALVQWTENNLCGGDMTARLPALALGPALGRRLGGDRQQFGLRFRPVDCLRPG